MTKRSKPQFLKRPLRFMLRFSPTEMREFKSRAKKAGLSQAEFSRRKIMDQPVPSLTQIAPVSQGAAA